MPTYPAGHGKATLAPSAQCEPAGHRSHPVMPLYDWNSPPAQMVHSKRPEWLLTVPGAQGVCAVLPLTAKYPALAGVQSLCAPLFMEFE